MGAAAAGNARAAAAAAATAGTAALRASATRAVNLPGLSRVGTGATVDTGGTADNGASDAGLGRFGASTAAAAAIGGVLDRCAAAAAVVSSEAASGASAAASGAVAGSGIESVSAVSLDNFHSSLARPCMRNKHAVARSAMALQLRTRVAKCGKQGLQKRKTEYQHGRCALDRQ